MTIGTGQGDKALFLENGGSLAMPGDFLIDTNGFVELSHGDVTTDRLIVQGTALVPVPPNPLVGEFDWIDNGSGPTSLSVNEIIVNAFGVFFHDRGVPLALPNTDYQIHGGTIATGLDDEFHIKTGRTLTMTSGIISTPVLKIESGATVDIQQGVGEEVDLSTGLIEVAGTLHMDGGEVETADFDADTTNGRFEVGLGGTTPQLDYAQIQAIGNVYLGKRLALSFIDGYEQSVVFGDTFELIEITDGVEVGTINGFFKKVEGVIQTGVLSLAVLYGDTPMDADAVPEVYVRASLRGDANVDGVVDLDDYDILSGNMYQSGKTWSDGDQNGNGVVNFNDFVWMALMFGETEEGQSMMMSAPAPGSGGMEQWLAAEQSATQWLAGMLGISPDDQPTGKELESLLADMRALLVSGETAKLTASFAQIPEPGVAALVVIGLVGVLRRGRGGGHGC